MTPRRFVEGFLLISVLSASTPSLADAQLTPQIPQLPPDILRPSLPDPTTDSRYRTPQFQEVAIPVEAVLRATAPATIKVQRLNLPPSAEQEILALTERLSQIDTDIAQFQRKVGAKSFQNLLKALQTLLVGTAPRMSTVVTQQELRRAADLLGERRDLNQRIWGIEHPGGVMRQGSYIEMAQSEPSNGNYQVYRSNEPATGSVVAPVPPPCRQEEQTRREYRNTLEPNGFDGAGTPMFRNVYHAFPVTELVTVCF